MEKRKGRFNGKRRVSMRDLRNNLVDLSVRFYTQDFVRI